jgi:hypothetical protein
VWSRGDFQATPIPSLGNGLRDESTTNPLAGGYLFRKSSAIGRESQKSGPSGPFSGGGADVDLQHDYVGKSNDHSRSSPSGV